MKQKRTKRTKKKLAPDKQLPPSLFALFPFVFILFLFIVPVSLPTASGTPTHGGTLLLAFEQEFGILDPPFCQTTDDWAVQRLMFRGLFDYDDQNRLILEQAQDWSLSEDRKTYTFHLRPGICFANGREVEAQDYIFSLERILSSKTGSSGQPYLSALKEPMGLSKERLRTSSDCVLQTIGRSPSN